MVFTPPTTKMELLTLLKDMDDYYKLRRAEFNHPVLVPLSLSEFTYTPPTDQALLTKAETIAGLKTDAEKEAKTIEINKKIAALTAERTANTESLTSIYDAIDDAIDLSEEKLYAEAEKRNMLSSSAYLNARAKLETSRISQKASALSSVTEKNTKISGEITALNGELTSLTTLYTKKALYEKQLMFNEYKDKEYSRVLQIEKHNNSVKAKNSESANSVSVNDAEIQLKYLELLNQDLRTVVLDSYYLNMDPTDAYNDFVSENVFSYYLGSTYYGSMLTKYATIMRNSQT